MEQHRVLVVDDEETIRRVLRIVLEKNGCAVEERASAEEALQLLDGWEPEVALVDIVLPGKNGLQLLTEIKQIHRDTEVLVMTSNASAETALEAIRQGAHDYLEKPFDLTKTWVTVQRALEKRSLALKNRELLNRQEQRNRELSSAVSLPSAETGPSYQEILEYFLDVVTQELGVERASLMLLDPASGDLRIAAARGISHLDTQQVRVKVGDGIAGSVAKTGEPFVVSDAQGDPRLTHASRSNLSNSFVSAPIALSVPLESRGEIVGVVNVTNKASGIPLGEADASYLSAIAGQLAVAISEARRSEQLSRAYESLKDTQEQLIFSERIKAVGQMAAEVAHDFNNVLSVIVGRAQLVLRMLGKGQLDGEKIRKDLDTIIRTAQQGSEVIRRIQNYTRIRKDVPDAPVDLNAVIRDAVEIAKPKWSKRAEGRAGHIETRLELGETPKVSGNYYELTQVVGNLIFNAVEAMPERGVLTFRTFADGDSVAFEVEDNGTGMDEQTRKRLFEPFFTTKENGQGLGTSIVYGIVSRHRGEISVRSALGQGTTFRVRLPLLKDERQREESESLEPRGTIRRARVLLVDGAASVRDVFEEALRTGGHEVIAVGDARSALEAFGASRFDVAITDLSVPGSTALDLVRRLRRLDSSVPVVLLSGGATQQRQEEIRQAGVDHVLVRPCMIEDLLDVVQKAIRKPVPA